MNTFEKAGFVRVSPSDTDKTGFNPFAAIGKDWLLVTAGNESGWNTMTVSWGFAGVMWGKNTLTAVIRPQRYTKEFVDKNEYFTVCYFGGEQREALSFCGTHSGRDTDKAKSTGLVPLFIKDGIELDGKELSFDVTAFEQAKMIFVCKKAYVQPMLPECFVNKANDEKWYANKDYHVQYIGEIVCAYVKEQV